MSKSFTCFGQIIEEVYNDIIPSIVRDTSQFVLSPSITSEVAIRYLRHKDLIEECHPGLDGSDECKIAGYITYWIAKLKPIQILHPEPDKEELFINEYLAISVANAYLECTKHISLRSQKFVDNLKYLLRYRTLTVRIMPLIYDAYYYGYTEGRLKNK